MINYDPPKNAEDYVHRIGRTGRAGHSGPLPCIIRPEQLLLVLCVCCFNCVMSFKSALLEVLQSLS